MKLNSARFFLVFLIVGFPSQGFADVLEASIRPHYIAHPGLPHPARFLVRVDSKEEAKALGLRPVTSTLAVATEALVSAPQSPVAGRALWAIPRHPLLDKAAVTTRSTEGMNASGLDGSGTLVGLIDTGVDISHPAFLDANGNTRVEWLLTFDERPNGLHPDLEALYGCDVDESCAIYHRDDLNLLLADGIENNHPSDAVGHGTHVLSSAAGRDAKYPGIASGAGLLVVQGGNNTGSLDDADILTGAQFLFDRAKDLGKPLVVNLSIGSSFGHHDGSSALEIGLAEMIETPGRAIVVAAGNDGGLYDGLQTTDPAPYGPHVELTVPGGSEVVIPLHFPDSADEVINGSVSVWLSCQPGDKLSIAFDPDEGVASPEIARGEGLTLKGSELSDPDDYQVSLLNGGDEPSLGIGKESLLVLLSGRYTPNKRVLLRLRGHGTVQAWVEGTGELAGGMLFPRARSGGTVGIPATHPALLAVGSSINRESWTDYDGNKVTNDPGPVGELSWFSGAGPNLLGDLKPDLLAPGENLIAGLSHLADPRLGSASDSAFHGGGYCPDPEIECYVVDDEHVVSSGTSMSAPLVSGTLALLFERQPTLTQKELRSLLRAGASASISDYPGAFLGAGVLDVVGSLKAQERSIAEEASLPVRENSRIALSTVFLPPDPERTFEGIALLRDAKGEPTGKLKESRFGFEAENGAVSLTESSAGYLRFRFHASEGSGDKNFRLKLFLDGDLLLEESLPIGVDPYVAKYSYEVTGGTCSYRPDERAFDGGLFALFLAGAGVSLRRLRRRSAATSRAL